MPHVMSPDEVKLLFFFFRKDKFHHHSALISIKIDKQAGKLAVVIS